MVELYGSQRSRRDLAAHAGSLSQFAGVRLMTLGDGVERGVRMLEFRSGSGLRFTVMIDRCLDIGDCDYRGMSIGWHSPAGFKSPALHDAEGEGGLGWLRSASGLLVTGGLDQILFMNEEPGDHFVYGPRKTISHGLHGRIGMLPARLTGYGESWAGDAMVLWCEGVVSQGAVFGEHLELVRRIEITAGTNEIRISDRVVNRGFYRTPHMYLYHINVGHPVLAEGSRYVAPISDVVWAGHAGDSYRKQGVGYRTMPAPQMGFHEQVWQHEMAADADGNVPVMLINDQLEIAFEVVNRKDQFPCNYQWQNFHAGQYAIGMEPSTNHVQGRAFARERGELIWLEHGEERQYDVTFRVFSGRDEIEREVARIEGIVRQPQEDYPEVSGKHVAIGGR
jgi:hypothetical protein